MIRNDIQTRIGEIVDWIEQGRPKNWICREIKCRPTTLDSYLKKNNIEYKGNQGNRGFAISNNRKSAETYLGTDIIIDSSKLRKKLIDDGIKSYECERCKNSQWMGEKIPLDLHHIDGDRFNNNLNNLQILCKNCHGLTPNHSRVKKYEFTRKRKRIIDEIKNGETRRRKDADRNERINTIRNSGIDPKKIGGITEISIILGISPQATGRWIKEHMNEFII